MTYREEWLVSLALSCWVSYPSTFWACTNLGDRSQLANGALVSMNWKHILMRVNAVTSQQIVEENVNILTYSFEKNTTNQLMEHSPSKKCCFEMYFRFWFSEWVVCRSLSAGAGIESNRQTVTLCSPCNPTDTILANTTISSSWGNGRKGYFFCSTVVLHVAYERFVSNVSVIFIKCQSILIDNAHYWHCGFSSVLQESSLMESGRSKTCFLYPGFVYWGYWIYGLNLLFICCTAF